MSTNFYATIALPSQTPTTLHIGKRTRTGLSTFNGLFFSTVQAWADFLRLNQNFITITDESGEEQNLDTFITIELIAENTAPSKEQHDWLVKNGYVIYRKPPVKKDYDSGEYWLDEDLLFYNGSFC
jgi:hypothetical protein